LLYVQATLFVTLFVNVQQVQWSTSSCHNLFLVSVQPYSLSLGSLTWTTMWSESKLQCSSVSCICTLYPDSFKMNLHVSLYRNHVKSSVDRASLWIRIGRYLYAVVRQSERNDDT
jgi:hypothetical protein